MINLEQTPQKQESLFKPLCGSGKDSSSLQKRINQAQAGHLPQGVTLDNLSPNNLEAFKQILGEFNTKVILVTDPQDFNSLIPEQLAIAGGWCALRTADVNQLNNGLIINPITNQPEKISSVKQVADWLKKSTTFDQIIEAVGVTIGNEIFAISEARLWSTRICDKLAQIFQQPLTSSETTVITQAIEDAEQTRFKLTDRYLQFVTNNQSPPLFRLVDRDVWQELGEARDELLKTAGVSLEDLSLRLSQPVNYLKDRGRIWAMYSQPYFNALRNKGIITSPQVLISEPVLHSFGTSEADRFIVNQIYHDKGIYFNPSGINPDTGFVVFIECLTSKGKSVRRELPVGTTPNISNWEQLFDRRSFEKPTSPLQGLLAAENNLILNPAENNLFIWGINFLPFGETLTALSRLVDVKAQFNQDKKSRQSQIPKSKSQDRQTINSLIGSTANLKNKWQYEVNNINLIIEKNLFDFFQFSTQDL
jgi:hypothetical protein